MRYSKKSLTDKEIWNAYNLTREAAAGFLCFKPDLNLRPIHRITHLAFHFGIPGGKLYKRHTRRTKYNLLMENNPRKTKNTTHNHNQHKHERQQKSLHQNMYSSKHRPKKNT